MSKRSSRLPGVLAATVALALALAALPAAATAAAPKTPVVMVLFDELPVTSLLGKKGGIDHFRYPNFAAFAQRSTWYANATTASDASKFAIPSVLDGRAPRRNLEPTAGGHPDNLFTLLHRRGYDLHVEEEATDLCPYPNCKRRYDARYFLAHDRLERFRTWLSGINPGRRPGLYYKHLLLPHVPFVFLPSGQRYERTVLGRVPGLNSSELSVFDPTLVRQSWQRHLLQAGAVDTLLGELVARLKQTGIYDKAIVVVLSDHGIAFRTGATDRRTIVPENARDIAPIPLFVKYPHQRRGRVDRGLVRTYDVLPTIAARIGLRLPRGLSGRVASSGAVARRRKVTVLSRARIGRITLSRDRLLALKRQALRSKVALFGSGRRSLFDFGPNRALRGRPVKRFRVVEGGRVRAQLNDAGDYDRIRLDSGFLPVHLTGRISGGRGRSRRDIAVAINGVIRGVSRSVRLRRRRPEYFSVLVDPRALVKGRNEVQVFAVSRSRRRFGLRRIYRSPAPLPAPKPPDGVQYPRPANG
ncbi:MAG: sulfatase-like hydrolase/transferase [Actinomycetota bacterium]|nr:sulfatase-like hydrolase/transferase [Actinomycetota bacterium]